jgi:probable F420-dependent oxidoreductase
MKFLLQHSVADPAWVNGIFEPAVMRSFAQAAEATGWDGLAFTDHPAPSGRWIDAKGEGSADLFSALSFFAAVTERIRLVSSVAALPFHNGFALAHAAATVDRLSAGRLTLGLGVGYLRSEHFALGSNPARRLAEADEALAIMLEAWTGQDVDHQGERVSAKGVRMQPLPVHQPHPPLWFHGNSRWGLEHAARHGQGLMVMMIGEDRSKVIRTMPVPDIEALKRRIAAFRAAAEGFGRDPDTLDVVVVGAGLAPLDLRKGWRVEEQLAVIEAMAALGVTWIISAAPGDDPVVAEESVRAFGEQVLAAAR